MNWSLQFGVICRFNESTLYRSGSLVAWLHCCCFLLLSSQKPWRIKPKNLLYQIRLSSCCMHACQTHQVVQFGRDIQKASSLTPCLRQVQIDQALRAVSSWVLDQVLYPCRCKDGDCTACVSRTIVRPDFLAALGRICEKCECKCRWGRVDSKHW